MESRDFPVQATIIVLTKSTQAERTKKCLSLIEKNTRSYELIVIRDDPRVFGFSKNNNRAMKAGLGKYFVLINDDCFVSDSQWLEKLIARAESEPRIGIVGPKLYTEQGEIEYELDKRMDPQGFVQQIAFACVLLKREILQSIGFMDESFRYGAEDCEYTDRAIRNGWKLAIAQDLSLIHLVNASENLRGITENVRGDFHWRRNEGYTLVHLTKQELYNSTFLPRRWVKNKAPIVFLTIRRIRSRLFPHWQELMNRKK